MNTPCAEGASEVRIYSSTKEPNEGTYNLYYYFTISIHQTVIHYTKCHFFCQIRCSFYPNKSLLPIHSL